MKTILSIIAVSLCLSSVSQTMNEKIWQFANDHLDQKVGSGSCDDLVVLAIKNACGCDAKQRVTLRKYRYSFGREIPKDSVMEGDIVEFAYFDAKTGKELHGHVGIVYSVSETNMSIINQNYEVDKQRNSVVTVSVWGDIAAVDPAVTQQIIFYRPQ